MKKRTKRPNRFPITTAFMAMFTDALRTVRERETPDTCFHFSIAWRALRPGRDGRLRATCPTCKAKVSRSAFVR